MMQTPVRDFMSREIIAASPEQPLSQVLEIMRARHISCVPVVKDNVPVGMFTERSFVRHLAENGSTFSDRPIKETMSTPVHTIRDDAVLLEAFHVLELHKIRHLMVVDERNIPVGVLTLSSIIDRIGNELLLEFQPIEKIMSHVLHAVDEDMPLKEVLSDMARHSISCVIYTEDGKPVGIITERDIVAVALEDAHFGSRMLCDVMHTPVACAFRKTYVHEVASLMRSNHTRRVVVVNEEGSVCGLVTQSDIMHGLDSSYVRALKQVLEEKNLSLHRTTRERDELTMVLESILRSSLDLGIVATDPELHVVYFNECAAELLGYVPDDVLGRKVTELHKLEGVKSERMDTILGDVCQGKSHTFVYQRTVDGEIRHHKARVARIRNSKDDLLGYVYMIRDITEEKRAEENIRFMAYHDMLTGLPNRVSLNERFNLELSRAERNRHVVGVMVVDLNNFKIVNDTLGHYAGDLLLQAVAERLKSCLRKSDTVARVGGDEFALLLPEIRDAQDADTVAEKIKQAMTAPFELKGEAINGTLSMGISLYPEHASNSKRLMELADIAMYKAKEIAHAKEDTQYVFAEPDTGSE